MNKREAHAIVVRHVLDMTPDELFSAALNGMWDSEEEQRLIVALYTLEPQH